MVAAGESVEERETPDSGGSRSPKEAGALAEAASLADLDYQTGYDCSAEIVLVAWRPCAAAATVVALVAVAAGPAAAVVVGPAAVELVAVELAVANVAVAFAHASEVEG